MVADTKAPVEVRKNDRYHSTYPTLDAARKGLVDLVKPGDRVQRQDPDGYRVKDRPARRRGWRK